MLTPKKISNIVQQISADYYDGPPIRVFLIEEQSILLWGLKQFIKTHESSLVLSGCAEHGVDLKTSIASSSSDVILFDIDSSHECAISVPDLVSASRARVLVFTCHDHTTIHDKAILEGAGGVLDRGASPEIFLEAIIKVHQGQLWLDRESTGRIFVEFSKQKSNQGLKKETSKFSTLTNREKKIVSYIFENGGHSARMIAEKLHISTNTLRNHLTSVYEKLGISNRFELISYTHKNGHELNMLS
jgi:two-component system nitrate/nitrite response regulator NarL